VSDCMYYYTKLLTIRMSYLYGSLFQTHMRKNKTMNNYDEITDEMLLRASACRPFYVSIVVTGSLIHRPSLLRKLDTELYWGFMGLVKTVALGSL